MNKITIIACCTLACAGVFAAEVAPTVRLSFDSAAEPAKDTGTSKTSFGIRGRLSVVPDGVKGSAGYFDGSSWLEAKSFPEGLGDGASPFSVVFWFRVSPDCAKSGGWISWGARDQGAGFSLRLSDWNAIRLYWNGGDANMNADDVCDGGWHHLVTSYDGAIATTYLDGRRIGSSKRVAAVKKGLFMIGRTMHDAAFTGWIDELEVFPRAVSAADAAELHRSSITPAVLALAAKIAAVERSPAEVIREEKLAVPESSLAKNGFTAKMTIDLSGPITDELLWSMGPAKLRLRLAGKERKLEEYDRKRGNYLNFRLPDGSCPVLEATIADKAGRIGVPLAVLKNRDRAEVTLIADSPRWRIDVDGEERDEEFPHPRHPIEWKGCDAAKVHSPRVSGESFVSPALPAPKEPGVKKISRSIQYWTPDGFNQWVGDVALGTFDGTLHVFYLIDRRHHQTGDGTGRHQFAHLRSRDLVHWEELPLAAKIEEDWQGCGTGTPFIKDGRLALAFGWHTDRFVKPSAEHPMGGTYATSDDGVHFTWSREMINDAQNPSIYNRPDGTYELVTSYGGAKGIFRSKDLKNWELFDDDLPFRGDCPSLFDWHGHRYLLQGFTHMAYSPDGSKGSFVDWSKRPDVLYDGLGVPMVTSWKDDRRLYVGWLGHPHGWGGWLVFREVVYEPDGTLGLKWVPEIAPPVKPHEIAAAAGEKIVRTFERVDGGRGEVVFRVDPAKGRAEFSPGRSAEGIRGLDRPYSVRLLAYYDAKSDVTIFDAEVAGRRTLICRSEGRYELTSGAVLREEKLAVSESALPKDGFTAKMTIDLSGPITNELLWSMGPAKLRLRMAGTEREFEDYDLKRGNYLNFRLPDGSCPVLEATIADKAGRIGVPLGFLGKRDRTEVTLRYASPSWRIDAGNGAWDEEFPHPRHPIVWKGCDAAKVHSPRVSGESFVSPALPAPKEPDVKKMTRSVQYWTPDGFNEWAGDVALGTFDGYLHVFYLIDRRHHFTGAGGGRHQFAHLRTRDLVHWEELPLAVKIEEDWQTVGTGTPFVKDGKMALAFGWHTDRYVKPSKEHPMGGTYSVSDDGIHFTWTREMINDAQNPSVYNRPDGTYELVTSYGGVKGIFRSKDLKTWELFDDKLPFRGDCPSLFDWHGHRYLLQGCGGFAYNPDGSKGSFVNWSGRPDAIYDGLCVPMVAPWKDDRRIYSGWLLHPHGWGGWLAFRELIHYPDGTLGMKWVPEIAPPVKPTEFTAEAGRKFVRRFERAGGGKPDLLFIIDPAKREMSFVDDVENPKFRSPHQGGNVKVGALRGIDVPYKVKLIVYFDPKADATIFDAEVAGRRTLMACREGRYAMVKGER